MENEFKVLLDEKDPSMALKLLQLDMSKSLSKGVGNINDKLSRLSGLLDNVIDTYLAKIQVRLESDTIDTDELLSIINIIQSRQIQIMDLYRKIVQGRNLFQDTLSDEEKLVLKLLHSFKTQQEKYKFLSLCEQQLNDIDE